MAKLSQPSERGDRVDERLDRVSNRLDRAVRLAIREGRSEQVKRRELDEKLTQLAAAQGVTEERLQGLIQAL